MTVSMLIEVPEELYDGMRAYLDNKPEWDSDRLAAAAFSLFILQNMTEPEKLHHQQASQIYLSSVFGKSA